MTSPAPLVLTGTMEATGQREDKGHMQTVWRVTFNNNERAETFEYFTGAGIEETGLSDVLECLLSDCQAYENASSPGEFAKEFGYTDVDEVLRIWDALRSTTEKLRALIGGREYRAWIEDADDTEEFALFHVNDVRYKKHGRWDKWYTTDEFGNMTTNARLARSEG